VPHLCPTGAELVENKSTYSELNPPARSLRAFVKRASRAGYSPRQVVQQSVQSNLYTRSQLLLGIVLPKKQAFPQFLALRALQTGGFVRTKSFDLQSQIPWNAHVFRRAPTPQRIPIVQVQEHRGFVFFNTHHG
jgi:hypothetical protein